MQMQTIDILWLIIIATVIVLTFSGFFIAVVIVNQRKFIKVQKEKLDESKRLQEVLRGIPRQMLDVEEEERARVARDLHDGIMQMLGSIKYRAFSLQKESPLDVSRLRESLQHLLNDLDKTIEETKRISHDLRPRALDDLGFDAAWRNICLEFAERTAIHITCRPGGMPEQLTKEAELGIFRIIQESLNNIEKHAQASAVAVESHLQDSMLIITINDNGKGFDENNLGLKGAQKKDLGLNTMRERASALGGVIDVHSTIGKGTTVTLKIPVGEPVV